MTENEKYLGNPINFKGKKGKTFEPILDKVRSRIKSWQAPLLSQAGRNTLIKSVASSIPLYNMSVLRLPKLTTEELDRIYQKFWWGGPEDKKNVHTIRWKEICKPIECGGLRIRESDNNNKALLARTCWKYLSNPDLLCTQILKAKYCLNKSLWEAGMKKGGPCFGRGLLKL